MDKKPDSEPVRINLGRLDANTKLPEIRPGDKVTLRVVNRYPTVRVALSKDGQEPVKLGRLDGNAKMPEIPPGAKVTVTLESRYPAAEPDKK